MRVKVGKKTFNLTGDELYTHIGECLNNEDQTEYTKLIQKLNINDIHRFVQFLTKDRYLFTTHIKTVIIISLLHKLENDLTFNK